MYLIAVTAAAVSAAAVGGLFYAFSTFAMRGVGRAEPAEAIAATQGINAEAKANAPFLAFFVGSAVLALGVGVVAAFRLSTPGAPYVLAGAALALVPFVVTMAFNIPLNNRIDAVEPAGLSRAEAEREWRGYLAPWMAWNHLRTVAPLVGAVLLLVGLAQR